MARLCSLILTIATSLPCTYFFAPPFFVVLLVLVARSWFDGWFPDMRSELIPVQKALKKAAKGGSPRKAKKGD